MKHHKDGEWPKGCGYRMTLAMDWLPEVFMPNGDLPTAQKQEAQSAHTHRGFDRYAELYGGK